MTTRLLPCGWRGIAIAAFALAAGGWLFSIARPGTDAEWARVERTDLTLGVEVAGTLRAVDTSQLGPPPIPDIWDFKISFLAPEGKNVKKGEPVVRFDTADLERRLMEMSAGRDSARKKLEQRQSDNVLRRRQEELRRAEVEARLRKASLKAESPIELSAEIELQRARLDLHLAQQELEFETTQASKTRALDEAALKTLGDDYRGAEGQVEELAEFIQSMTVKSPRDGTVIYAAGRRDEKKQVGDSCWRSEKVVEIPNLQAMKAEGEVDEALAGAIRAGQKVSMHLDAHPDVEFRGSIKQIARTVQRRSRTDPAKIVRLEIELEKTDATRMRPGMRFRGKIQTGLVLGVLVVPLETVCTDGGSPVLLRRKFFGFEIVPVSLGQQNQDVVEVRSGLGEGNLVARRDLRESRGHE